MDLSPPDVVHRPGEQRFESTVEGHRCVLRYRLEPGAAVMTHVGVPPPVEGRGIAAALTRTAVAWARSQGLEVVPVCPYVAAWMRRHPGA